MGVELILDLKQYEDVRAGLQNARRTAMDLRPTLRRCIPIIRRSLDTTFKVGGRPQRWPPRWQAIESIFPRSKGKSPLLVTGRLRQSVVQGSAMAITPSSLFYGTNLEYAAVQNFGGKSVITIPKDKIKKAKAGHNYVVMHGSKGWFAKKVSKDGTFTINVRARPFMHLMEEDVDAILDVFRRDMVRAAQGGQSGINQ